MATIQTAPGQKRTIMAFTSEDGVYRNSGTANEATQEVVKLLTEHANGWGDPEEFAEELGMQHRTLQQGVTRMFVAWMRRLRDENSTPSGGMVRKTFDARNEASVVLARLMFEEIDEQHFHLPTI